MSGKSKNRRLKAAIATGGKPYATAPAAVQEAHDSAAVTGSGHVAKQQTLQAWQSRDWLPGLLLIAGVMLAYYPAWHAGFIWDDDVYVVNNRLLTAPDGLWRIWFSFDSPSQYFPLVYTSFRLEYALWGLAPLGYHCVNILLHGVNAVLLWRLLLRLEIPGAWLGAAIFALHPVQVESVAWVTELKNVQMGFFFLLSLLAWTGFVEKGTERAWRFYGLSLIFYALALCSKTTACTLPAALLLMAWLRGERICLRKLMEVTPFVVLGIGMGLLTVFWERYHQGTQGKLFTMGVPERVLIACRGVWFYLDKLFWPAKLTFSYPRWMVSAADPVAYVWLAALCGLGAMAWFARRFVGRSAWVALAFFMVTLGPVLGFIMLYTFRYTFVADHYQYLACIGPIVLVSAGMERLHETSMKRLPFAAPAFCAMLLLLLAILTWRQSGTYRDAETLWRATFERNPESWLAHNNLGHALFNRGHTEEAIVQYHEALRILPEEEAHNNLGNALLQQGDTAGAIAQYRAAIEINPDNADSYYDLGIVSLRQGRIEEAIAELNQALKIDPTLAEAYCSYGNALLREGRTAEAVTRYNEALRIDPACTEAYCNLGNILLQQGRIADAIADYREALRTNPASANAHYNLGNAEAQQGRIEEAAGEYREALRNEPTLAEASNSLGYLLLQQGRTEEAVAQFNEALRNNPTYAEAQSNLGKGLFQLGRTAEAIGAIRKALELKPSNAEIQNNLAWLLACAPQLALRDGARAVQLATQASQSTGGSNPLILRTLAAAYAGDGQYAKAVQAAQTALQLAESQSNSALANALRREMKLYEAGQPFEEGQ
jgi:tetratricopeptide (TPR) repeat protein